MLSYRIKASDYDKYNDDAICPQCDWCGKDIVVGDNIYTVGDGFNMLKVCRNCITLVVLN